MDEAAGDVINKAKGVGFPAHSFFITGVLAVYLASKTLEKINEFLERDQGSTFRRILRSVMPLAEDAYKESDVGGFRNHLGASLIGRDCSRELWYTFRWATVRSEQSRMLRLYNRGHLEEPRFVALLKMIGCEVWQYDDNGRQFRVSASGGHFGGSLDAVIRGCPDISDRNTAILGEFKTHGDKSFQKLQKEGVRSAKFEHYVQQQIYMKGFNLPASLYFAVNKNDDELYAEIVVFDPEQSSQYYTRGDMIINATMPPPRISDTPGFWKCKFCDHIKTCHLSQPPARNCRTCQFSTPSAGGTWICELHHTGLLKHNQIEGCPDYQVRPM